MTVSARPRWLIRVAALAAAALACAGQEPRSDHYERLARAARGFTGDLRPDWGPGGPRGIACAPQMRDRRDTAVRLTLADQEVRTDTTRRGNTTTVERWSEGNYAVTPAGRYSALTLRVDCSRGAPIAPPGA